MEHILGCVPMSHCWYLASGGTEVAGMEPRTAVPATEAKAFARPRCRDRGLTHLIVSSAISIIGPAVLLGERRRGNGGSENYHGAESFQVGHLSSPLLCVSAKRLQRSWFATRRHR